MCTALVNTRLDGQPSAVIQLFQLPDANGIDVANQAIATVERIYETAGLPMTNEARAQIDAGRTGCTRRRKRDLPADT